MRYVLLDANVVAGYYLPRSLTSKRAAARIENLMDAARSGKVAIFFWIPNFCIAEVFSVFMKHAFSKWNTHVKRAGGCIDRRVYERLVRQLEADIHNGKFLNQCELSRYHILGINLVAPLDHYYQFTRGSRRHVPMGTFDHLLISMGIHLAKVHGAGNVTLVTADDRVANILARAKKPIPPKTVTKLKLHIAKRVTGRDFSAALFPQHANLKTATDDELAALFGEWPLPVGKLPARDRPYRWTE